MFENCIIYAIDVGDAYMRGGVYADGVTRELHVIDTPRISRTKSGQDNLLQAIRCMIDRIAETEPPMHAFALSASGIMTLKPKVAARSYGPFRDEELYVLAPNIDGLKYVPILSLLEQMDLGVRIHVENDVNAALASVTDVDNAVCINLGAGLGAAIKRYGKIQHPPGTWSCYEIGHGIRWNLAEEFTRRCHCGSIGCLEAAVGGWAIAERYGKKPEDAPLDMYENMRNDVLKLLPQAIAGLVTQSGITNVVLSGKGCVGYQKNSDFLSRITQAVNAALPSGIQIDIGLVHLGESAEMHGAALSLLANGVLDAPCDNDSRPTGPKGPVGQGLGAE